jgi:drug/metabolite transporter (DMT)-like permease
MKKVLCKSLTIISIALICVSLLLSRIFLKEKLTKKQYMFITIIIVGILMLAVLEGE